MTPIADLASNFVSATTSAADWTTCGPQVLPILLRAREQGGDLMLAELVEAVVGAGVDDAATAVLAYLGDVIREAGFDHSATSFAVLQRYLTATAPHVRLGASAGMGSIMNTKAAFELQRAAKSEPLAELAAFQRRSSEVIERNVAADPENPNAFALAV